MIYSVTADKANYEQIYKVIVIADNPDEAIFLAKKEFDLAKEWFYPWEKQKLLIEKINVNNKGVLASVMA